MCKTLYADRSRSRAQINGIFKLFVFVYAKIISKIDDIFAYFLSQKLVSKGAVKIV